MLYVNFMYEGDELLPSNSTMFRVRMRDREDLLSYEFAQRVIREIDGCEPAGHREVKTSDGRYLSLNELAGGTKGLLMMAYEPKIRPYYFRGGGFGDNCVPYILELCETIDIKLAVGHLWGTADQDFGEVFVENTNKVVKGWLEFANEYSIARFGNNGVGGVGY